MARVVGCSGLRRLGQPPADGGYPLGQPCALVEHARDRVEGARNRSRAPSRRLPHFQASGGNAPAAPCRRKSPASRDPARRSGRTACRRARPGTTCANRRRPNRSLPRCRRLSQASATVMAKIETVSSVRQAGTMPVADSAPSVGFSPTMPFSAAGTRPEPAVSVPSAKAAMPRATATAEPEDEPPGTIPGRAH